MKIDTRHRQQQQIVTMLLQTPEELALTDDLLARIGCNQHQLDWDDDHSGTARLGAVDPASLRLTHKHYEVTRQPSPRAGEEAARIVFHIPAIAVAA